MARVNANDSAQCEWCGKEIALSPRGRRRKYCDQTCRQRAYEHRKVLEAQLLQFTAGAGEQRDPSEQPTAAPAALPVAVALGASASAGLSPSRLTTLRDGLFELRCAAEDVETAVSEGADADEIAGLCRELVVKARGLEHFR